MQILSKNTSSHTFSVGRQDANTRSLYMFEFRDPSDYIAFTNPQTYPVPFEFSPSLGLLISASLWGPLYLKRRLKLNQSIN